MLIEIISHCYAGRYPHYADALVFQFSSLLLHPSTCRVLITVCYDPTDERTRRAIHWFRQNTGLRIRVIPLFLSKLGRRAIGRNIAAKSTRADLVWFADVDQCFRNGILDRLAAMTWDDDVVMKFPRKIKIHKDWITGDHAFAQVDGKPRLLDIDPEDFVDKKYGIAIGGVQIVQGDFARKYGYLHGHNQWQRPVRRFMSCKGDPVYRHMCKEHGRIEKVDLPGVFRMRHTQAAHQDKE